MGWLDDNYQRRVPIAIANPTGAATGDVEATIPADWDAFWNVIDSAGIQIRVTAADGRTVLTYAIDNGSGGAFLASARLGRIRIDTMALINVANTTGLAWLYFDTVTTVVTGAAAVTITSPLVGTIETARPVSRVQRASPHPPGLARPTSLESKSTAAQELYWVDLGDVLHSYDRPVEGRRMREEIRGVLVAAYDTTGAIVSTIPVHAGTRFVETVRGGRRTMFVRVKLTGGVTNTRYTVEVTVSTAVPGDNSYRTIVHRFGLAVSDILEPLE
jgi:hypothetical protein